jgi:hypothetical protein
MHSAEHDPTYGALIARLEAQIAELSARLEHIEGLNAVLCASLEHAEAWRPIQGRRAVSYPSAGGCSLSATVERSEGRASRRGLLRTMLAATAATVSAGALLQTHTAVTHADSGVFNQSGSGEAVFASGTNGADGVVAQSGGGPFASFTGAGQSSVTVTTPAATPQSIVLLTPMRNPGALLWVSERSAGSFTISASASLSAPILLAYLVVN